MSYYLAPALEVLRAEINARWPRRDRASDGWIGDPAHQATKSDHNPNSRGSVNAIDVDEDGINVAEVIAAIERHPSTHYWIYERQIADRDDGFRRRPYSGTNPHTKHLHVSIRQTRAAEQDTRPWGLLEDDVSAADVWNTEWQGVDKPYKASSWLIMANTYASKAYTEAKAVRAGQAAILAAIQGLDTAAVLAEIRRVADEDRQRDAELPERILAALPAGGGPVSRDDLEAALRTVLGSVDNDQQG